MSVLAPLSLPTQKAASSPRARVKALLNADVPLRRITVESGVRSADIKAWIEGANLEGVEAKLIAWIEELDQASAESDELPWAKTAISEQIESVFEQARRMPTIAVIHGAAGAGKTMTAMRYTSRDRADGRRTVYFAATNFIRTPSAVLFKLAEAVERQGGWSLTARAYRSYELYEGVAQQLAPGDLIIVDESQHIESSGLDTIRAFHDQVRCGIAYMGNTEVFVRITGKGRRAEFAQLASRCGARLEITAPTAADIDACLEKWAVKGAAERQFLHMIGSGPGGLRQLANCVRSARIAARDLKRPLDAEVLRAVASMLGID